MKEQPIQPSGEIVFQAEETASTKFLLLEPTSPRKASRIVWLKLNKGKGNLIKLATFKLNFYPYRLSHIPRGC